MSFKLVLVKDIVKKNRELILYGCIGAFCSGLDFVVFSVLGKVIPYLVANVVSTHCGIICSFFLNRHYNFKVKDKVCVRFLSFYFVGLLGLGISELLLNLMIVVENIDPLLSKVMTIVIVALVQFFLNKYLSFRK